MPWGSYLKPRSLGNLFECNNSASSNYTLSSANKQVSRKPDQSRHIEIHRLRLDVWGGCLNVRKMRGGTRNSMHSWGIALDYDPQNNQLKWVATGLLLPNQTIINGGSFGKKRVGLA